MRGFKGLVCVSSVARTSLDNLLDLCLADMVSQSWQPSLWLLVQAVDRTFGPKKLCDKMW